MSDPLRVALVAEGPTDLIVIQAALKSILGERSFVLTQIFPETSLAFDSMGTGWAGVYKWCHKSAINGGGRLSGSGLHSPLLLDCEISECRAGRWRLGLTGRYTRPTDRHRHCSGVHDWLLRIMACRQREGEE